MMLTPLERAITPICPMLTSVAKMRTSWTRGAYNPDNHTRDNDT